MLNVIGMAIYRLLEQLDGERGQHTHIIKYKTAQGMKVLVLRFLIK